MTSDLELLSRKVEPETRSYHGKAKTSIYKRWQAMLDRCYNSRNKSFKHYGARGIRVCGRWHEFVLFYYDLGDPPFGLSLERRDNDGNYCPSNVCWATRREQSHNTRRAHFVEYNGQRKTIDEWAREIGLNYDTLFGRLFTRGWTPERAFNTPVQVWARNKTRQGAFCEMVRVTPRTVSRMVRDKRVRLVKGVVPHATVRQFLS